MVEFGFTLSAEEQQPSELVRLAGEAERAGFSFVTISDHFHPWTSTQGNSPFVWSVLGGIASATERIRVGTAVTCPLIRMHPVIVAHAAATVTAMMPGRFFLGLGTGENLNEHVTGARWPSASERRDMLEEALEVIRELWGGDMVDHHGRWYQVVDAQLFTRPQQPPPIYVAAGGVKAAELAGRHMPTDSSRRHPTASWWRRSRTQAGAASRGTRRSRCASTATNGRQWRRR